MVLFDCLTCDKCIPICPNDANFSLRHSPGGGADRTIDAERGRRTRRPGALRFGKPRQIGTFADVCNECGHCDVLCPEDGGPYLAKPLFFGSVVAWAAAHRDGFVLEKTRERGADARPVWRARRATERTAALFDTR